MQESKQGLTPLDMSALIISCAESHRAFLEKRGNRLTIRVPGQPPKVNGNADRLIPLLTNLISNANAHTRDGGIEVSAALDAGAGRIAITVRDTGAGIAPDILPHVFERGVFGKDGKTRLGLAISKEIAEAHGGMIAIESELGEGTAVTLTLPVLKEEAAHE
jgi:signal transduction histidine kinase